VAQVSINPTTGALEGIDRERAYTASEFEALPRPTCPECGKRVTYARIRNSSLAAMAPDSWLVGRLSCPDGCNMATGS